MGLGPLLLMMCVLAADPPLVSAAEAAGRVGDEVTIEMKVASSRLLPTGQFCFLNSKKSFTDKDNFTIAVRSEAIDKFAAKGLKDIAGHFQGKTIRVTGKVTLYQERPQILVTKPEQIVEVVKIE